jgi:hypothetical protein
MPGWKSLKTVMGFRADIVEAGPSMRIRFAVNDDVDALVCLARLDSQRPPRGPVLVAEVGRSIWAALSLDSQQAISDPRRPTGELVWVLLERAREIRRAEGGTTRRLPRVWPSFPDDELSAAA